MNNTTLEAFIQNRLSNISEIQSFVGENIFPFISDTNVSKCFIRWAIISEDILPETLSATRELIKTAEVQISVFANTINAARTILTEVEKAFNFDNSSLDSNILSSRTDSVSPIVEDKETVHYPLRVKLIYKL